MRLERAVQDIEEMRNLVESLSEQIQKRSSCNKSCEASVSRIGQPEQDAVKIRN